jgi:hypothetical protein
MLSGGSVSGPRTTVSGGRPDNKRRKGATVGGNIFNRYNQRLLHRGSSILS